jgi:hypothetical protein
MKIRHDFTKGNVFIINHINESITSLELSDEHSINNIVALLDNNKSVCTEYVKNFVIRERKKKKIIFNISRIIMGFIISSLIFIFFSNDYIALPFFAGIICVGVSIYSTICDIKRNKQLNEIII